MKFFYATVPINRDGKAKFQMNLSQETYLSVTKILFERKGGKNADKNLKNRY